MSICSVKRVSRLMAIGGWMVAAGLFGLYLYDHDGPKGLPVVGGLPWRFVVGNTAVQPQHREVDGRSLVRRETQPRSPRIVFLGDSLTKNWLAEGRPVWDREFGTLNAAALGVSGDRIQNLLFRIRAGEFRDFNPEVVVLLIGTNNVNRNTAEEIADGVMNVVGELRSDWPDIKIVLLAIPPRELPRSKENLRRIDNANAILAQLCTNRDGLIFVNDDDRFVLHDGYINPDLYSSEGVHLSERGYEALAQMILPAIQTLATSVD